MAKLEEKIEKSPRSPVVAILGHIDHGKSTLIDYIRKTNVTGTEAGGITQHISAYEITHTSKDGKSKRITFLDTPGHEAFTSIRSRCANVADLAILVVSADDGVKPQTIEVIKHIKECSLPYLVAITKIDKPSADIARAKQSLAENEIYVEGYGGSVPIVELSAKTGQGVEELLDMICLITELESKTAEKEALGSGVIIESHRDPKRGITVVGIIQNGTVREGLFASSRGATTPIRFLLDSEGNMVEELSFSSPVQIVGWDKLPMIGEEFKTFLKKDEALDYANSFPPKVDARAEGENQISEIASLPIILKADKAGSLEAVSGEIEKLSYARIVPRIVLPGVGGINENDIKQAQAISGAVIIGFNTKVDRDALHLAERLGITILIYNIIYELIDKVKELLIEREPKISKEEIEGSAKVLKLFGSTKGKQVIGARVTSGMIKRGVMIKIVRRESEIGQGRVKELQQSKIETDSVGEGSEFGAMVESKFEIAPGDLLNAITLVTK